MINRYQQLSSDSRSIFICSAHFMASSVKPIQEALSDLNEKTVFLDYSIIPADSDSYLERIKKCGRFMQLLE